ncbi:unnamed protein product [Amoebophrya sp. A120]|nr:unnamed protein product [Amoebophrya sp. A120]|eukprot:GSA120T00015647001.1
MLRTSSHQSGRVVASYLFSSTFLPTFQFSLVQVESRNKNLREWKRTTATALRSSRGLMQERTDNSFSERTQSRVEDHTTRGGETRITLLQQSKTFGRKGATAVVELPRASRGRQDEQPQGASTTELPLAKTTEADTTLTTRDEVEGEVDQRAFLQEVEASRAATASSAAVTIELKEADSLESACNRLKDVNPGNQYSSAKKNRLYLFSLEQQPQASGTTINDIKCNDGSDYVFYWNPCLALDRADYLSTVGRWVFYLQSGGDAPTRSSYDGRSEGLKSSKGESFKMDVDADRLLGSTNTELVFHDFNKVYFPYCSSDKWAGNSDVGYYNTDAATGDGVFFHGYRIIKQVTTAIRNAVVRQEVVDQQKAQNDLALPGASFTLAQRPFEIVLAGSSAGAAGTGLQACTVFHVFNELNLQFLAQKKDATARGGFETEAEVDRILHEVPFQKFGILQDSAWYVRGPPSAAFATPGYLKNDARATRVLAANTPLEMDDENYGDTTTYAPNGLEQDYMVGAPVWNAKIESGCDHENVRGTSTTATGGAPASWTCFFPRKNALFFLPNSRNEVCNTDNLANVKVRHFVAMHGYDTYLMGKDGVSKNLRGEVGHAKQRGKQYLDELRELTALVPLSSAPSFFVSASVGHVLLGTWNKEILSAKVKWTRLNDVLRKWWENDQSPTQYANGCIWHETAQCLRYKSGFVYGDNPTVGENRQWPNSGGWDEGQDAWEALLEAAQDSGRLLERDLLLTREQMRKGPFFLASTGDGGNGSTRTSGPASSSSTTTTASAAGDNHNPPPSSTTRAPITWIDNSGSTRKPGVVIEDIERGPGGGGQGSGGLVHASNAPTSEIGSLEGCC